ncbi:calaxin-like isoform X1 [Amphiprion ocellaris]|uniref:calaxin-like isoform X1 n=1 Tax=Amphiprion ocellaris TaxID=80972 RepID=UPI001649E13A|nr:calaxin-like isoform X1 [Amphiprion ocellaris]
MSKMSAMNRKVIQTLAETISKQVEHFNKTEAECLIREFNLLLGEPTNNGRTVQGLDRARFRSILHHTFDLTDDIIMDGAFRAFDKDNDGIVSLKEWIEGLSVLLRGTLNEKIKCNFSTLLSVLKCSLFFIQSYKLIQLTTLLLFCGSDCFHVYDLNGDGFITREEMFRLLKNSLVRQPTEEDPDEGVKDLVEITLKKMDHDHDGKLSFDDFEKAVREENLLLEAFGTCLPDSTSVEAFEQYVFQEQLEQ